MKHPTLLMKFYLCCHPPPPLPAGTLFAARLTANGDNNWSVSWIELGKGECTSGFGCLHLLSQLLDSLGGNYQVSC